MRTSVIVTGFQRGPSCVPMHAITLAKNPLAFGQFRNVWIFLHLLKQILDIDVNDKKLYDMKHMNYHRLRWLAIKIKKKLDKLEPGNEELAKRARFILDRQALINPN
jgi:hypothetical protein